MTEAEMADIVGQRIGFLRARFGYTQEELAAVVGLTQISITTYENGKRLPHTRYLLRFCDIFGVDLGFFDPRIDVFGSLFENINAKLQERF